MAATPVNMRVHLIPEKAFERRNAPVGRILGQSLPELYHVISFSEMTDWLRPQVDDIASGINENTCQTVE